MTDRELLELAAKAAGVQQTYDDGGPFFIRPGCEFQEWNPLTDDGDALRLAVRLHLGISIPIHRSIRADVISFLDPAVNIREGGNDPAAATRRAIVRSAAELGRRG